jgi:eukaryotic-like serine/threonine-protein kinase
MLSALPAEHTVLLGKYAVEGVLGRGGMGVVLAARDIRTGQDVAIKVLEVGGDSNIGRFEREASVVAALESEHLVRFIEAGSYGSMPCIVMERLRGEDFAELSERGLLPLQVVGDCVVQTCEALAHAHGAGVIHRDIKPSNLFQHRHADGTHIVKVLDFGISKCLERLSTHDYSLTRTSEGVFLGSARYMSPEQFRNPRRVDGRADLWSLGVVAYRLLSGEFPYAGETSVDVFAAILETSPPTLRELGIDVPHEVDLVIRRCLTRKREERFANALELARAFAMFASPDWQPLVDRIEEIVRRNPSPLAEQLEEQAKQRVAERAALVARQPTVTVAGKDDSRLRARAPSRPVVGLQSTLMSAPARVSKKRPSDAPPESQTRRTPPGFKAVRRVPRLDTDDEAEPIDETELMRSETEPMRRFDWVEETGPSNVTEVMLEPPIERTVLMASAVRTRAPSNQRGPLLRPPAHESRPPPEELSSTTTVPAWMVRTIAAVAVALLVIGVALIALAVSHGGRFGDHGSPSKPAAR